MSDKFGLLKLSGLVTAPFKELGGFSKQQFEQYSPINQTFASYFGKILPINALYQDPIAKSGRMFPARIGPFIIFGQTSESISLSNKIASHPMMEGGIMADHVFSMPEKISIKGLVTEFNSNILEDAILNGQLKSLQNLYHELKKGGMGALDAVKQIAAGYQKRKHIVDKIKELMINKGDFRYTYASNLVTVESVAIESVSIAQNGDERPMEISFDLVKVKTVKLSTVDKDYFTGLKRKEKSADKTENAGDAGVGSKQNVQEDDNCAPTRTNALIAQGGGSAAEIFLKKYNCTPEQIAAMKSASILKGGR